MKRLTHLVNFVRVKCPCIRYFPALAIILMTESSPMHAQPRTNPELLEILSSNKDSLFREIISYPSRYRLQVIYTRIDRDAENRPVFTPLYFNHDPDLYFNPASMVKLPLAALALEKINDLKQFRVTRDTRMVFEKSQPWQTAMERDATAITGFPSIAQFIRRALLVSENDPYNRLYQFVGQEQINRRLRELGLDGARITRQFLGLSTEQNRHSNGVRFLDENGELLYTQAPAYNETVFDFSRKIRLGNAHYDRNDSLVPAPFDFTEHNLLSLQHLQQILQAIIFPSSLPSSQRFRLGEEDRLFLLRYLSQYPSETADPLYDTTRYYDSYVKFFFRAPGGQMPGGMRVFNKVGWSYGFMTDVSYIVDFENQVEFMLAATLYVNSDGILNDNRYEYEESGYPFLYQLGQTLYRYELARPRAHRPILDAVRLEYETRPARPGREPLSEVDN